MGFSRYFRMALIAILGLLLTACTGKPEGVEPVAGFDAQRYLGTWHEIARLDHVFERGLEQVTATYQSNPDGSISVLNRGFDVEEQAWREAQGVARFVGAPDTAHLKVSFFGPFYGSYIVFDLGQDYDYAFVSGFNRDYLWLLARTPEVDEDIKTRFISRASELGFAVDQLIWLDNPPG